MQRNYKCTKQQICKCTNQQNYECAYQLYFKMHLRRHGNKLMYKDKLLTRFAQHGTEFTLINFIQVTILLSLWIAYSHIYNHIHLQRRCKTVISFFSFNACNILVTQKYIDIMILLQSLTTIYSTPCSWLKDVTKVRHI